MTVKDRKETTMGNPADLEFRPRDYRGPTILSAAPKPSNVSLEWKIAIGIFLGLSMFALATCASMAVIGNAAMKEQQKAEAAAVEEFKRAISDPDPLGWQRQAQMHADREAMRKALLPGQRCIKGERFRRVDNGWVQLPHDPC